MEKTHRVLGLIYLFLIASISVNAEPVALVEDVSADRTDVQFMDFLEADQVIELADGEKLVLGNFLSCKQETITGGTVSYRPKEPTGTGRERVLGSVTRKMEL